MPKRITEAQAFATTPPTGDPATPGRVRLKIIDAGWGSSGYYSPKVLENAATAGVFAAGTHVYFDHPGVAERGDRPERTVRDLAAALDEDAVYENGALWADARIIGPYQGLITDPVFMESVGMSIRASADTTVGEAEGRRGVIITELVEADSVDIVTRPGRGGRIVAAVESARRPATEASAGATREALNVAVRAAHGSDDAWTWIRDYDPDQGLVWFEVEDGDSLSLYEQAYTLDDSDDTATSAALTGDPTPVRAETRYVPITSTPDGAAAEGTSPASPAGPHQEFEETNTMTETEESRDTAAQLVEAESRVAALTTERDQAVEALAAHQRDAAARAIITARAAEAGVEFTALETRGLLAEAATTSDGALDEAAFTTAVDEAAQARATSNGDGDLRGLGAATDTVVEAVDVDTAVARAFGRTTTKEA